MEKNGSNIELSDYGASSCGLEMDPPRGILRGGTSSSFHGPNGHTNSANGRNVAWNSLPSSPGVHEMLGAPCGSDAVGAAVGDWQHTLALRRRQGLLADTDSIDGIAQAMEGDSDLMADDINGEVKRRNAIRELTQPLALRKEIKRRLTASSKRRSKKLSLWQRTKYSISMSAFRMSERMKAALHDYSLWHNDLKIIEGSYGTGIGTYFVFLRYLLLLNLSVAAFLSLLLLVPQLVGEQQGHVVYSNSSGVDVLDANATLAQPPFKGFDWLTGAGWLLWTELYYSGYSSFSVCMNTDCTSYYDMRLAYICSIVTCFLGCIVVIARRVINLYKEHAMNNVGDEVGTTMATVVFSLWDCGITEERAAKVKHGSIYNELKATVLELQQLQQTETRWQWVGRRAVQALCWFVVLCFMALLAWFVYELLENLLENFYEQQSQLDSYMSEVGTLLVFPVIVSFMLLLLPMILEHFVKLERYSNTRIEVAVTLSRTTLLELLVLTTLLIFWYKKSPHVEDGQTQASSSGDDDDATCWEASLGAELYRLTVVDFLVQFLGSAFLLAAFRLAPSNRVLQVMGEFSVSRNTLYLVFTQTLVWAGLFVAPLLSMVAVIKFAMLFYLQKLLLRCSLPPLGRPWRAAQTQTVFFALIFVSLIATALASGFIMIRGCSSTSCGPLVGTCPYVHVFWEHVDQDDQLWLLVLLQWLVKPAVVAAITVCLIVAVYWARAMALGRQELVAVLRRQLELEAKDRAFLIDVANKIASGQPCVGVRGAMYSPLPGPPPAASGITRGSFTFSSPHTGSTECINESSVFSFSPQSPQANGNNSMAPMDSSRS